MFFVVTLPILAVILGNAPIASAQINGGSNVTCTEAFWEYNDIGQTPCWVWGEMLSLCGGSNGVIVTPLYGTGDTDFYWPPGPQYGTDDACRCNVVSYNLMASCTNCQADDLWYTEDQWKQNCSSYAATGVGSLSTSGMHIPVWASLQNDGASWNADRAQAYYDNYVSSSEAATSTRSSSTTSASSAVSTTSTSSSTSHSSSISSSSTTSSLVPSCSTAGAGGEKGGCSSGGGGGGGTNTGAIAGGVVGGVVGLILIGALIFWLVRRNQKPATGAAEAAGWEQYGREQKPPISAYSTSGEGPYSASPTLAPGTTPSPYPYQPGGPAMGYGGAPPASPYPGSPLSGQFQGQQEMAGRYTGLPEVEGAHGS